jgi:uncharacterized BrkB/YihY/UPF0761 family membrane protein
MQESITSMLFFFPDLLLFISLLSVFQIEEFLEFKYRPLHSYVPTKLCSYISRRIWNQSSKRASGLMITTAVSAENEYYES